MADPLGPSILAAILLILAAMVYALNTALPHADATDLKRKADSGNPFAGRILRLLDRYDEDYREMCLSYALLVCGGYASLISWLMPFTARQLHLSNAAAALLVLVIYSFVSFAFTAIVPGGIANHSPKMTLKVISGPAEWSLRMLSPVTGAAFLLGKGLLAPFRIKPIIPSENVTEEEIRMMVDIGGEKGAIEADEKEMIENIFEFNNMNAEDCMVHRKDMTAVDLDATEDEVLEIITQSGLSRFPVYEDSVDNIVGILTSRDFLINRCSGMPKPMGELVRPALFVPESVHTDVLFREMQTRKQHMAIVIDEYGGTSGLITLEDLLEEIVGSIYDEFDPKEEQDMTPLPDGRWRVSGSIDLETLGESLGVNLPLDEEYDTLGGLVFSHLTEIPADGEHPEVECFGLRISVSEIADRRVEWAIVEVLPVTTGNESPEI